MTFDDGILTVYRTENTAKPGKKPVPKLKVKGKHYFNYGELGITEFTGQSRRDSRLRRW